MVRKAVMVATATVLLSGLGLGQPMQGTGQMKGQAGQGPRQRLMQVRERGLERLNLTDEQKKETQKLRLDLQRKNIPIQSQIRLARLDIREQMSVDMPDKAKIEKLMKQVSDLQLQVKMNGLDHMFAVRNILTPEQLKDWHGMMGPGRQQIQRRFRIFRQGMGMNDPAVGPEEAVNQGEDIIIDEK